MKKILFFLALGLLVTFRIHAQTKLSLENVRSIYIRSNGSIMEGEVLKGYFVFYVSDKIDKHTDEYTLQIMDDNLNKIKDIKFEDDKNIQILESSYNGNTIMFLFYNKKEKTLEYRAYGFDGKQKMTYTKELNKRSNALLEETYGTKGEDGQNEALFSVGNKGYTTVFPVKEGKYYSNNKVPGQKIVDHSIGNLLYLKWSISIFRVVNQYRVCKIFHFVCLILCI